MVSTLAGSGAFSNSDGFGTNAAFRYPTGMAIDASGNVFVADESNNRIRKVTAGGGTRISPVTRRACEHAWNVWGLAMFLFSTLLPSVLSIT